jgi:hypothetical protein
MTEDAKLGDVLDAKVRRAIQLRRRLARLEEIEQNLKAAYTKIIRYEIPDLFDEIGGSKNRKVDGIGVAVDVVVRGSLGQAPDEEAAVDHLRALGFEGAIKTKLQLDFSEAERGMCSVLAETLAKELKKDVTYARDVHHSTLAAFAAERMRAGKPVKLKTLGLSAWREAKLTGKGLK